MSTGVGLLRGNPEFVQLKSFVPLTEPAVLANFDVRAETIVINLCKMRRI